MSSSAAKQQITFRLDRATVARLRRRALETHTPQSALAERYIEEGMRRDEHPLIYFREGAAGHRPALVGTRLDVAHVVATIRQNGNSVEEAAAYLEIPIEHVEACMRYYVNYQEEVNAWRARAAAERERERWRRRQQSVT